MRVLVAMSGGVDSSVAAALLRDEGHEVVGATMKLWGGASDSGCCSVRDVDDARRVAQQLGIDHHVFNFTGDFERDVVEPYVADHVAGLTPNPCVACNRHLKFDRFIHRSIQLGFDAIATGHYARVSYRSGHYQLRRAADPAKDQSYVLHMLGQEQLARVLLPLGGYLKPEVRALAAELGLRTAAKPDSQDVCFISRTGGREAFLAERVELHPGRLVDSGGTEVGTVAAVELITVGQRRGLGGHPLKKDGRQFAVEVDVKARRVRLGSLEELMSSELRLRDLCWTWRPVGSSPVEVLVQTSAHGTPAPGKITAGSGTATSTSGSSVTGATPELVVYLDEPQRRVAPGQSVVLYDGDVVLGGGTAATPG